jgi:AcrR family transcriptional regulator
MPKLWNETIEEHRRQVSEAVLDTTAALIGRHGLLSVTMSQIAEETGIGRATLYKYFSDVETILFTWHERQVAGHLEYLAEIRNQHSEAGERLKAVLEAFALISYESQRDHRPDIAVLLHQGEHVGRAENYVRDMVQEMLVEAVAIGSVREDLPPNELADYCFHALTAASTLSSNDAVRRLVAVILDGLRPPRE